jgi:membrane-bound serine protease (ClpP class)
MTVLSLALLFLGLGLLVAEAHLPTFGVVGAAGVAAVVAGLVLALLGAGGSLALALALALPVGAGAIALGAVALGRARVASRRRARCGAEGLVGRLGVVRRPLDPQGQVLVDGALWSARRSWAEEDEPPPAEGERVVVDQVNGLTLRVRRAELWEVER